MPKILVVDDAETQRIQIRQDLEKSGFQVVEAGDGHAGLEQLASHSDLSLIICDVNMPGMDGLTMCTKIRDGGKFIHIPIFMLTTEASPELKQTAKTLGVRAWITKPYSADKLVEAIKKVVKS